MISTLDQWKSDLSALPVTQRAELAQYLLDSLEADEKTARTEWLALAKQRMADVRTGRVTGTPAAEVLKSLVEMRS